VTDAIHQDADGEPQWLLKMHRSTLSKYDIPFFSKDIVFSSINTLTKEAIGARKQNSISKGCTCKSSRHKIRGHFRTLTISIA